MQRVTGIGGVFFKAKDAKMLAAWYEKHLGIPFQDKLYTGFNWVNPHHPTNPGHTAFSIFDAKSEYFAPSGQPFMFNFRVMDLRNLIEVLRKEGVTIVGELEEYDYGLFAWIMDPEGNKIELWEPIDEKL
jgi:predicted enzyme related to lactoylglutathione lyase